MERGNTKHGPLHDEEMAHETESMLRGAPQRAHAEEWREVEPLDGADPVVARPEGARPQPAGRDIELRSELARTLTRDAFPADRDALRGRLADADASSDLIARVADLPAGHQFGDVHEVLEALGINSPETRTEQR
jgi:hypothetical protein